MPPPPPPPCAVAGVAAAAAVVDAAVDPPPPTAPVPTPPIRCWSCCFRGPFCFTCNVVSRGVERVDAAEAGGTPGKESRRRRGEEKVREQEEEERPVEELEPAGEDEHADGRWGCSRELESLPLPHHRARSSGRGRR
eukprot:492393-Hanusia_phi.AAC.2